MVYLRPETCQPIFAQFQNIVTPPEDHFPSASPDRQGLQERDNREELHLQEPGIRTDGNGILLSPRPVEKWYEYWVEKRFNWYTDTLGVKKENLRLRKHTEKELAHYATGCTDIEYRYPFLR